MKKIVICALVLMLAGCISEDKVEETHSYMNITSGDELVSVYRDGEDITEERKALKGQTEEVISQFLNRKKEELEFETFCMLGEEGMTVEVMVDKVSYTFTCSIEGEIVGVGRTDGKTVKFRKNNR